MTETATADQLRAFMAGIYQAAGVPAADAATVAGLMTEADLIGADGHGVFRLAQYVRRMRAGGMNPRATPRIVEERPAAALIDGDNGLGHLATSLAARTAIEKARTQGVAWCGVRNGNHAGPASLYARMVQDAGMIGLYFAVGSANHLLGEYLKNRTRMDLVHVPYKGSAAGVQALATDEVQVFFDTIPSSQGWIRQGKVKLLAIASHPRTSLLPGVPTLVELGIFESSSSYWMGLMAPPKMPVAMVTRINAAAAKMMASAEMNEFAAKGGGETAVGTPAEFTALLLAEQKRSAEVIRRNNIRAE